jgi:hypothetical protein
MKQIAIMVVEKGEEIAGMWISDFVPGIGSYKLLAKKRKDGMYEWAHFVERANGYKDKIYRGEVESEARLKYAFEAINKALSMAYGEQYIMRTAKPTFLNPVFGSEMGSPVH